METRNPKGKGTADKRVVAATSVRLFACDFPTSALALIRGPQIVRLAMEGKPTVDRLTVVSGHSEVTFYLDHVYRRAILAS